MLINVLMVFDNIIFFKILWSYEERVKGIFDVYNYLIRYEV